MLQYDRTPRQAAEDDEVDVDLQALQVADYVVFLLALDTYMGWIQETGGNDNTDPTLRKGLSILRMAERQNLETISTFIKSNLASKASIALLDAALRPPPTPHGASIRALKIRTVLSKGGTATTKAVFGTSTKARREVQEAIDASMIEDPDVALNKFSALVLRNKRLEKWIDEASEVVVTPGGAPLSSVQEATKGATDGQARMLSERVQQEGKPGTDESLASRDKQAEVLGNIEAEATESAKKALRQSGEEDKLLTRSEVIGVATATATAVASDPDNPKNVPEPLRSLDAEQRAAAMTDGRVLVAACAGSGKTTTLTSRVSYLVKDKGVDPARIMVICFNKKASREIKERIASKTGDAVLEQMSVGTMHSMFRKFIVDYGNPEEKAMMTTWMMKAGGDKNEKTPPSRAPSPGALGGYMARLWKECTKTDPPKRVKNVVQKWEMNDVSPEEAAKQNPEQAEWYRWTLGFKGKDKTWKPPCVATNPKAAKMWGEYLAKWRDNGRARLGDFSDMILSFRDILKRSPEVRKKIQGMYDHFCVDEAQDLNSVQHQIVEMLSEHVTETNGKSVQLIGDPNQSINAFVGAKSELFTQFANKPEWTVRNISTNYRCLPEIIETANTLMTHHPQDLPFPARPDPKKPRGKASIVFNEPVDHATGAIQTITQIAQDVDAGSPLSDYAVLTRTNMEMNDFETSCIMSGVPYARRGGSSFLKSPETTTVMSYVDLAVGQDFAKMQASLAEIFNKPNRFFLRAGESERIVQEAIDAMAREIGIDSKQVPPEALFTQNGINKLIDVMDPHQRWESWKVDATRDQLEEFGNALNGMRSQVLKGTKKDRAGEVKPYTTQDLIGDILNIKGVPEGRGKEPPALRDVLMPQGMGQEEDADDPDEKPEKPIGNVAFLFQIAQSTGKTDDPSNPRNFKARLDELAASAKDLRVDLDEWDAMQQRLAPADRKAPSCVTLSTIHCSPADEPVLTTQGYVPMGELDPEVHRLASFTKSCQQLMWGMSGPKREGYPFIMGCRSYEGELLTVQTAKSKTRITPNHRVMCKFSDAFMEKYVVYLMRRGEWWRVGMCVSAHRPYRPGGVGGRLGSEQGDAGWILGVFETREEALFAEAKIQGLFGLPGLTFESAKNRALSTEQLHQIHEATKGEVQPRALRLLEAYGLDVTAPLYERGGSEKRRDMRNAFVTKACNLLSGYMEFPVVSDQFVSVTGPREVWTKPEWYPLTVTREQFKGDVFSLTVMPHRYYVSGGAIVHNSVKGAQWPSVTVVMAEGVFPHKNTVAGQSVAADDPDPVKQEVRRDFLTERQLAYVAFTRAARDLTVVSPKVTAYGKATKDIPQFVTEAGLKPGQNVPGKNDPTPDVEPVKTVLAWGRQPLPDLAYDRSAS